MPLDVSFEDNYNMFAKEEQYGEKEKNMVKNLRELRRKCGMTQKELGNVVGLTQQTINKYENGNAEPNIRTLIALADYFETSVDYLIGRTSE